MAKKANNFVLALEKIDSTKHTAQKKLWPAKGTNFAKFDATAEALQLEH